MILTKDWNTEFLIVSGNIVRCLLYHILWQEVEIIKVGCLMHAYCLNVIALHLVAHFFLFSLSFHSRWLSLCPPPLPMERLLKTWLFQLWWPIHFLFFFLFFLMMWSIFRDQGAGDSGKSTIFKQVGRNSLLFQVWTCVCQHCCFLSLLVYVLDADKTFVSKWFWRGRAQELYLSHPCERLSDNKSMQNLKWCVGYFPFLHNLENTKCLAFVVKLLDS